MATDPCFAQVRRRGGEAYNVRCPCCACEGPWAKSEAVAVGNWNRRADEAIVAAVRDPAFVRVLKGCRTELLCNRTISECQGHRETAEDFEGRAGLIDRVLALLTTEEER